MLGVQVPAGVGGADLQVVDVGCFRVNADAIRGAWVGGDGQVQVAVFPKIVGCGSAV